MFGSYLYPTRLDQSLPDYFRDWLKKAREEQKRALKNKGEDKTYMPGEYVHPEDDPEAWIQWMDLILSTLEEERGG